MSLSRRVQLPTISADVVTFVLIPACLFLVAALIYAQYGFLGTLILDDAVDVYAAQQLVRGVPLYQSAILLKGPVTPLLSSIGVLLAPLFGRGELVMVRYEFWLLGCLTVVALYLLAHSLSRSRRMGVFAALAFIGCWGFGRHVVSGPRPKTPVVLIVVLCLWLIVERRWVLAGLFASLGFLTWQPLVVYIPLTLFFSFVQAEAWKEGRRNLLRAAGGALLPLLGFGAYLWLTRGVGAFIECFFLYRTKYLGTTAGMARLDSTLHGRIRSIARSIVDGYALAAVPIFTGIMVMLGMAIQRVSRWRKRVFSISISRADTLRKMAEQIRGDRYLPLVLSFFAPLIWSFLDYQSYPDFYMFLPYVTIGFAVLLDKVLLIVAEGPMRTRTSQFMVEMGICVILVVTAYCAYEFSAERGLRQQRTWARAIETKYLSAPGAKLWVVGRPEILVLLERSTPNRYLAMWKGMPNMIEAQWPGGFSGWVEEIGRWEADVIAWGGASGDLTLKSLEQWLGERYTRHREGEWVVFVRHDS